ncbi:pyridoxine kinase [Sporosarcina sp. P21c]|uniref:pyridoxamine kinase n=1 Tax=Sporosarcina TaxID=1569 RepID=UPI000A157F6D|nr:MULTISPECIES: pyridoxamine kinase [Sporosarcina]ARJ37521.1 pyridoxine kinase [Sporosarcina ureae]PIC67104.1 pyridoxine kinase [Sporosarcina sp. P16a]PIC82776.1 pyridoxine kinase [Sporosarcina sp. P1]PIC89603.1 pyridoxine kinase [Sporosarcina sp. P21c]PIC92556.1 pyridoxine kinase [Sporosarcina sp. P25]
MKKVAIIQDLSSFGKCSLTAAIPVLSVMGVQACPLPTAMLTAQTEYPSYYCNDLTSAMPLYTKEWEKLHVTFDGIHTGYITGKEQIHHILTFLESFYTDRTLLLVDPVLGDNGKAYDNFDEELLEQMKVLVARADIITPNITECCLLTGYSYDALHRCVDEQDYLKIVEDAGKQLQQATGAEIIITGIQPPSRQFTIGNMYINDTDTLFTTVPYNNKSYSGTGDLFASVLMGSRLRGMDMEQSISLAKEFLLAAIEDTALDDTPLEAGVNFEKYLRMLL